MAATHLTEILLELQESLQDPTHPFRHFGLATTGESGKPSLRTVILRDVSAGMTLTCYTDVRSAKVSQIRQHPTVSLLFYHPEKHWQLRIDGHAAIQFGTKRTAYLWDRIPPASRTNYSSSSQPGSRIQAPAEVTYLDSARYFCIVDIRVQRIESLQLHPLPHRRRLLSEDKGQWEEVYLVP